MNLFSVPTNVLWMYGKEFCEESLSHVEGKKVLLVMNNSNISRLSLEKWVSELKLKCSLNWINEIPSNPTYMDVFNILRLCNNEIPEFVITIGGGSSIDMAKACVALWYLKNDLKFSYTDIINSIKTKEYLKHHTKIQIYAVPTTAGTGSEVTRWATVWDVDREAKYSVEAPWLCPNRAYIVPEYTRSMPKRLTLSTGLDALCHAMEAYWAKSSNSIVREMSKTSIQLIVEHLPQALSDSSNLYYREKMCLGSLFAGFAFSNTRTTACHSISYPLTMRFGVEHGFACALTLAKMLQINLGMIKDSKELLAALGIKSPDELQLWLDNISCGIIKLRLSSFGVEERDIPDLVKMSFTQGRMDNNPVAISQAEVSHILWSLL